MHRIIIVLSLLFPALVSAETVTMRVSGMTCVSCAQAIEARLTEHDAVEKVAVDVEKAEVVVTTRETAPLPDNTLKTMVSEAGYKVESIRR